MDVKDDGVLTVTQVKDPDGENADQLTTWLQNHVQQMSTGQFPVHSWDPLFAAVHEHFDEMPMEITNVDYGVKVKHTGEPGCPAKIVKKHANVVTKFIENGRREARKGHSNPSCGE